MKLSPKQFGVLIALVLGGVMLFLPVQDRYEGKISHEESRISPFMLSDWIILGQKNYTLIDTRTKWEFEKEGIRGAINIPFPELLKKGTIKNLPEYKMIVLYDNDGSNSIRASQVLKAAGFNAYALEGGLNSWGNVILNPQPPSEEASEEEYLRYRALVAVANFYKGKIAGSAIGEIPKRKVKRMPLVVPLEEVLDEGC